MSLSKLEQKLIKIRKAKQKKQDDLIKKRDEINAILKDIEQDYQQESKEIKTKMQQILKDL